MISILLSRQTVLAQADLVELDHVDDLLEVEDLLLDCGGRVPIVPFHEPRVILVYLLQPILDSADVS